MNRPINSLARCCASEALLTTPKKGLRVFSMHKPSGWRSAE
ncbi:hypothetical protein N9J50_02540 [Methylophilaceae bacterium]|nr:hypothetical protein [Methylophilaceae bacterium]